MKTIGIKLADGSFYPILEEGTPKKRILDLTTVKDNQTTVQVDLYRSEIGSMSDAEYVDTLEVTKLNPHPNGELDLHLSVGIDENNELSAEVVDSETGKKSEIQVQLINRTLAERENPSNFEISDTPADDSQFSLPDNAIDDSELAALEAEDTANAAAAKDEDAPVAPADEPKAADTNSEDFSFDDMVDETFAKDEEAKAKAEEAEAGKEEPAPAAESTDVPFSFDSEEPTVSEADQPAAESAEPSISEVDNTTIFKSEPNSHTDSFIDPNESVPDIAEPAPEPTEHDDSAADETKDTVADGTVPDDITETKFELPDFDETFNIDSTDSKKEFDTAETKTDDTLSAEPKDDDTLSSKQKDDDTLSVEPKDDDSIKSEPADTTAFAAETPVTHKTGETDFTVPDFDNPGLSDGTNDLAPKTEGLNGYFDDPAFKDPVFTEPDLDTSKDPFADIDADIAASTSSSSDSSSLAESSSKQESSASSTGTSSASPNMDFSSLYDKETIRGEHATAQDGTEDVKKKTRPSVIICIICAIICIIATALVLFVIPSRYNLITAHAAKANSAAESPAASEASSTDTATEQSSPDATAPEADTAAEPSEPVVPPAPVSQTAEPAEAAPASTQEIVPEPLPKSEKKENVRYHIKWGDTLWDISEAYYKNPWRYKKLAKFNHIKNPDLIISGTYITIPAE